MVTRERVLLAAAVTAFAAVLTGCGASGTSTAAAGAAESKAKADLSACLDKAGVTQLLTASGRASVYDCFDNIVPPAARTSFRNCVTAAAVSDKIWTSAGRTAFLNVDGPACVNAALSNAPG